MRRIVMWGLTLGAGLTIVTFQNLSSAMNQGTVFGRNLSYEEIHNQWVRPPNLTCPSASGPILFGEMAGVKTLNEYVKPTDADFTRLTNLTTSGNHPAVFSEIQPMLYNVPVVDYLNRLIDSGINTGEIRLDIRKEYGSLISDREATEVMPPPSYFAYAESLLSPYSSRTPQERKRELLYRQNIVRNRYSATQQAIAIIGFLRRVNALSQSGQIHPVAYKTAGVSPNFKFMIGTLAWFGDQDGAALPQPVLDNYEEIYADQMALIINAAQHECLDHWLAGVFFFEPASKNITSLLDVQVKIAEKINAKTGQWLKRSGSMLFSGGGWGADYSGMADMQRHLLPGTNITLDQNFFEQMRLNTGAFAFAYKAMEFKKVGFLAGDMVKKLCDRHQLDRNSAICQCPATDSVCLNQHPEVMQNVGLWQYYFDQLLKFEELQSFVNANEPFYPRHANVVFVGDSSDGLMGLKLSSENPSNPVLKVEAYIVALSRLFVRAGLDISRYEGRIANSWRGKIYLHGYRDPTFRNRELMGLSIHTIDNLSNLNNPVNDPNHPFTNLDHPFTEMPQIHLQESLYRFWKAWPHLPSDVNLSLP